jgi:hypothetical protein
MTRIFAPLLLTLLCGISVSTAARAPGATFPTASQVGVVQELDFGRSQMIVNGTRYSVALDVRVEIGGSYGAFTMLQPGMKIRYDFLVISPSEREIVEIHEIPAGVVLEQA